MEFHEAANIFPLLEGQAFVEFREDIRNRGQLEPIVIWRGKALDGRNRYRACQEIGIIPLTREVMGDLDPVAFVLSTNLHRRHLSESQRAMVGAKAKAIYEAEAKERQRAAGAQGHQPGERGRQSRPNPGDKLQANLPEAYGDDSAENAAPETDPRRHSNGQARDKAAAAVNVSPRTIEHASSVIKTGTPELVALVESGDVAVSAAATVATLPKPEQERVVREGPRAIKKKAKEIREKPSSPAPAKPPPAHPHSDRLTYWLKEVASQTHIINVGMGGIGSLLAEPDKWSRRQVGEYILPMLEALEVTIHEFREEISRAFER